MAAPACLSHVRVYAYTANRAVAEQQTAAAAAATFPGDLVCVCVFQLSQTPEQSRSRCEACAGLKSKPVTYS